MPPSFPEPKPTMKRKKHKRVGSFLCFGAPLTDDDNSINAVKKKPRPSSEYSTEPNGTAMKKPRRSISKMVKSFSFKAPREKLQKEQSVYNSIEKQRSKPEAMGKMFSSTSTSLSFSSASTMSSSSSSSRCLVSADEPRVQPRRVTFRPPPAPRNNGYATGLFLVVLSLFVMVFCGRLCAILWTATWLCLVPRQRVSGKPPDFSDVAAARRRRRGKCGEEEKKRVVLEGFLQRNRK